MIRPRDALRNYWMGKQIGRGARSTVYVVKRKEDGKAFAAKWVLKSVDFAITAGQSVCLCGINGAGKSTLVKLLPRLYSPESGRLLVDQYDIDKVELYSLRRQIGIVPQDTPVTFRCIFISRKIE